jgi:mannan endo-1,4-beta-mannosidase
MKKILYGSLLAGAMLASACEDDHKPDWNETSPFDVAVTSVSIADGAVVSTSTNEIEVVYDYDVALNSLATITLNNEAVEAEIKDGNRLIASISLTAGENYVFNIPANAVAGIGSKSFAPEVTVTFSTEGAAKIMDSSLAARTLTNPNATAETVKLYNLLLENYGKKQFSGVMGEVAWSTTFADMVADAAGKYPAIVGFDYIHLASSPANWIDYGDITPVKNVWDAGSIPSLMWHWNVPKSSTDSSLGYDASSDEFKASNVLVDGTWENQVATADVEKLAGYLQLLQDAGIPVLWRPFHEAAGDYTWGHWFWWGNCGTDTTKELWKWLRDKLQGEYGLNNLIWVWTVQTADEGKAASLAKMQGAYPGDDVVDIVGTDIYADALSNQSSQFELVYNTVAGKKMVALTECGNLLDVDASFADGALWSYFMGWYELKDGQPVFGEWNTAGEWKRILDNPLVLNRGDFEN